LVYFFCICLHVHKTNLQRSNTDIVKKKEKI